MVNIFDQGVVDGTIFDHPYPIYEELRRTMPLCWSELKQAWIVTRYKDIDYCLLDKHFSARRSSVQTALVPFETRQILEGFYRNWLLYQDIPDHPRIKKPAHTIFAQPYLYTIFEKVREKARAIIQEYAEKRHLDIVKEYGQRLALQCVCDLFAIPQQDHLSISVWSNDIVDFMQGRCTDLEIGALKASNSIKQLMIFINELIETQRDEVSKPLFHFLRHIHNPSTITEEESAFVLANILIDGHEPIANAIANAALALATYPDQLEALSIQGTLLQAGVDELLRYDAPFQYVVRYAQQDHTIGSTHITKGQRFLLMIASANRDPEIFSYPNRLDLTRTSHRHRAFGFGHHYCLGATVAKPLLQIAIDTLVRYIPSFKVEDKPLDRHQSLGSRALKSLVITWE